jgi:hypothetical protein
MIAIRGMGSNIANALLEVIDSKVKSENVVEIKRDTVPPPTDAERYLFCQGFLYGKKRVDQTYEEIDDTYRINYRTIAAVCDYILDRNDEARICVIGSESGI